jgi:Ni/Co efflux regulator RcnB
MNTNPRASRLLAVLLAATLGAGPVLAQPPWAGGGKGGSGGGEEKHERKAKHSLDDRADSEQGHGKGKGGKGQAKGGDDVGKGTHYARKPLQPGAYFNDRSRDAVHTYYASAGKGGKGCPPGLAKKNNGCLPPGQAKKWNIGQPLPSDVVVYPVPSQLVVSLPPVPVGHKYVQVAGDILLIAIGSKMVVDGISGLSSR